MIGESGGRFRFFCGRVHGGPLLPRYSRTNGDGWRKTPFGAVPDRQWHPGRILGWLLGIREVWTCRRPKEHWRWAIVPPREVFKMTNVIDFNQQPIYSNTRRNRLLKKLGKLPEPDWKKMYKRELRPHQLAGVELGHAYYFNRRQ